MFGLLPGERGRAMKDNRLGGDKNLILALLCSLDLNFWPVRGSGVKDDREE